MSITKYFKDMTAIIGSAWKRGTFISLVNLNLSGALVGFLLGLASKDGAAVWQWALLVAAIGFMIARALLMARLFEDDEARAFNAGLKAGRK